MFTDYHISLYELQGYDWVVVYLGWGLQIEEM